MTPTTAGRLRGCFVTGTDTEIGKTTVACGLLHALGREGRRVAGIKPVAAGTMIEDGRLVNEDVERLRRASAPQLSADAVCGALLQEACAPHIAASLEGRRLHLSALVDGVRRLAEEVDAVVVEGVGGFCVPLDCGDGAATTAGWGADDLAVALDLPVVMAVGLRLGCINHALLTAQAVQARGLRLAGWIGSRVDARMSHADANIAALVQLLQARHGASCLGLVPHLASPDPAAVAAHLIVSVEEAIFNGR